MDFSRIKIIIFDFDGVFTDNTVWTDQEGNESVRCWRSDGIGLSKLKTIGINMYIVSTEKNPVVSLRAAKLDIPCVQSVDDKGVAVRKICGELNIELKYCAYLGNDINDLSALEIIGYPMAVADSHHDIMSVAKYVTKRPGGFGAVREVCDLIASQTKPKLECI